MYSNQSINQSMRKSHMLGPHQSLIIFAQINSINPITWNYKVKFMLLKYFKNGRKFVKGTYRKEIW